jgi:hypothetical protein
MKLVFSETQSDYGRYLYPYVVWALPEPGERPADFFRRGFLPASPHLDCYYLCRNLRLPLAGWRPNSENRRILRKGAGITATLMPRGEFDCSAARRAAWLAFAEARFGAGVMPRERLDTLLSAPVITHLLHFTDADTGAELGTVLLYLEEPDVAYYYYAFYDLAGRARNLGMYMMTRAAQFFAERGVAHLYLGTCYSERALYKTRFDGIEFCNGFRWSADLRELKYQLTRDLNGVGRHLLDVPEYRDVFYGGSLPALAAASAFRLAPETAGAA